MLKKEKRYWSCFVHFSKCKGPISASWNVPAIIATRAGVRLVNYHLVLKTRRLDIRFNGLKIWGLLFSGFGFHRHYRWTSQWFFCVFCSLASKTALQSMCQWIHILWIFISPEQIPRFSPKKCFLPLPYRVRFYPNGLHPFCPTFFFFFFFFWNDWIWMCRQRRKKRVKRWVAATPRTLQPGIWNKKVIDLKKNKMIHRYETPCPFYRIFQTHKFQLTIRQKDQNSKKIKIKV